MGVVVIFCTVFLVIFLFSDWTAMILNKVKWQKVFEESEVCRIAKKNNIEYSTSEVFEIIYQTKNYKRKDWSKLVQNFMNLNGVDTEMPLKCKIGILTLCLFLIFGVAILMFIVLNLFLGV